MRSEDRLHVERLKQIDSINRVISTGLLNYWITELPEGKDLSGELVKGFEASYRRVSREAIRNPKDLIGRQEVIGEILGSIYSRIPVIVVTGPKGIGKTSVLRVVETYFSDDNQLKSLHTWLSKTKTAKREIPEFFDDFRKLTPYPFYVTINRISEPVLAQELMKCLLTKAEVDSRLRSVVNEIVNVLRNVKKVKVGPGGVEFERELSRIAQAEPIELLKTICMKIREKFSAGTLLIMDDADRLVESNRSVREFREELFRFMEGNRGLLQVIVCVYLNGSLLQPLKYSDQYEIGPLRESEAVQLVKKSLPQIDDDSAREISKQMNLIPLYVVATCLAIRSAGKFDRNLMSEYIISGYRSVMKELEPELVDLLGHLCKCDKPLTVAEIEEIYPKKRSSVYAILKLLTNFKLVEKSTDKPSVFSPIPAVREAIMR